jgi:drug/metabolite transporter (DMT)-like permease
MDRRSAVGIGLVVISAAGYGSGSILAAPIYSTGVDWLTLVSWRFLIGALLGWGWVLASPGRRAALRGMTRRQVAVALALGALFVGNAGTYYASLETVPAALAGVVVYTYPVMVAVLSLRFATRLPGPRPWIAAGLAVTGSALALGGIDVATAPPVSGLVLVFASAVIYSVWIILSARLSGERRDRLASDSAADGTPAGDAAVTTTLMMSATAAVYAAAGLSAGRPLDPVAVPDAAWPGILAVAFVASFLAIQTFYAGARRIGAARAALTATVEPLIIVALAWLFLHQTLAPIQLVGAGFIIVAVVVAQTAPRPTGAPEPATPLEAEVSGSA